MAVTAVALADLRFGLRFASGRYRSFARDNDPADNAGLFIQLARERSNDANEIEEAAASTGILDADPTINDENANSLLGLGRGEPLSPASAAFRVQRAENTLGRMAAQLGSLADPGGVRNALDRVRGHIDRRRDAVREARRRAQGLTHFADGASRLAEDAPAEGQEIVVWFGTNRRKDSRDRFVGERADDVSYGRCHVFVPKDRGSGSLGRGLIGRLIWGDNRVKVDQTEHLSAPRFWSAIKDEVASLGDDDRHGLLFLHGYQTKFNDAAKRTAQLKVDLAHAGPAAFFSWPSLGEAAGYAGDEAAIEGSELAIREFLVDFATRSGATAVHIIAHSMGNRGLLRAMDAISKAAKSASPIRFGQVFLAAPDVDVELFENLAAAYKQLSVRATLYVTNNDKAIGLSQRLHRFPRVGLTPPVAVLQGIDTVDASHVNLGLIGHGYSVETRPVLADIHRLLQSDTSPDRRFGLRKALGGRAQYWEFVP
jgi:esterase/lipase superfamily enzyme